MLSREELLKHPNFLLSSYQNDIYNLLMDYKESKGLSKSEIAKELGVSKSYVSQILNGDFNFTLKKIIQLGLATGKVPYLEFVTPEQYWERVENIKDGRMLNHQTVHVFAENLLVGISPSANQTSSKSSSIVVMSSNSISPMEPTLS